MYKDLGLPFELHEVELDRLDDKGLAELSKESGVGLSLDEMQRIRDYFKGLGRNPTDVEFQALGQAWSEHCCYKSSKPILKEFIFGIDNPLVLSRGDAGVMEFDEEHAYSLRIESHNHPSAIEPYGGAATGIGGIVRDVLCMGCQPIALIDPLFFGPLDQEHSELPPGIKHPKYLLGGVVDGIRDYGNRIGIPTISGGLYFDPGYTGNCIVNVGCVGIARKEDIQVNAVGGVGENMVLAGGLTGRDGIHGVTFASAEITEKTEDESRGAVQLGDPITKEPLIHSCLEIVDKKLLSGMKDLGGGGLSCVSGEMAFSAGYGVEVYLDRVPLKEEGLSPWEIWVSESQERMMLAVKDENLEEVLHIFKKWDVEANVVGRVIEEPVARILYHDHKIFELDLEFFTGGPEYCRPMERKETKGAGSDAEVPEFDDLGKELVALLSNVNACSRDWVVRQYDHEVRARTVVKPLVGKLDSQCHQDATVLKPLEHSHRGLAMAMGVGPWTTAIDPYRGGKGIMDEAIRGLAATGARIDSFTNCLNFGNPEKPDRLGIFYDCVRGMGEVASAFDAPVPSGNVSFYNETPSGSIPPTAVLLGLGIVQDIRMTVTTDIKGEGNLLYHIGPIAPGMGGSLYARAKGVEGGEVPDVDVTSLKRLSELVVQAIEKRLLSSCHDISDGGLACALAEMCMGGGIGADVQLDALGEMPAKLKLFSESPTRWLAEVEPGKESEFLELFEGEEIARIGSTGGSRLSFAGISGGDLDVWELYEAWHGTLWEAMG